MMIIIKFEKSESYLARERRSDCHIILNDWSRTGGGDHLGSRPRNRSEQETPPVISSYLALH